MHRSNGRVRAIVAGLAATLALVTLSAPVAAAPPLGVTIVSNVTFNPDGPNYGDFETAGSATDSGLICEAGTFVDTRLTLGGFQSDRGEVQLMVRKEFTCDDGTGTFFVQLAIHANFDTGIESFMWVVQGGTGDHAKLRGSGSGSTVSDGSDPQTGNINTYIGFLIG